MRLLITGNLGFVGSVATTYLAAQGHEITGLDAGFFSDAVASTPQPVRQITRDVRAVEESDLPDVDAIVHLAALSNDPLGELNSSITENINVGGSIRLAKLAKQRGISRFVFASSCSMYGVADGAVTESSPQNPQTAYALSKVHAESQILAMADDSFSPISLRFATAYGFSSRPRLDVVVNNLVACALLRGRIELQSDGTPWRPLIHVEDMARAMDGAARAEARLMGAYNVGSDIENYQVREIAEIVANATGNVPLQIGSASGSDTRSYQVSFERYKGAFPSFLPARDLRSSIDSIVSDYRAALHQGDFDSDRYFRLRRIKRLIDSKQVDESLMWVQPAGA